MKERPILFSAPMVRAILAGTKKQTRRALRVQPPSGAFKVSTWHHPDPRPHFYAWEKEAGYPAQIAADWTYPCPYGQPGDRLWVKETFQQFSEDGEILYKANPKDDAAMRELKFDECLEAVWRPSIFMPRRLSRITLEITDIRVERLQEISTADAWSEGIASSPDVDPVHEYAELWKSINGAGSWDANPWVWCVGFKRLEA